MKKPLVIGIALIVGVIAIGGYFASKKINQSVGENIMEKMIEAQTGNKVDIESGSNGQDITIKTDDGQTQFSAGGDVKVPANFPQELILADDAKLIIASSSEAGGSIAYLTNLDQTTVFNKYIADLSDLGWKKTMEVNSGEGKMITVSKDQDVAYVTIGENSSKDQSAKTLVNIVWATNKDE